MVWQYLSLLSVQPSLFNPQNSNMEASFYKSAFIRKCRPVSGRSTIPLAYSTTCSLFPGVRSAGSHRSEQALLGQDTFTCNFQLIDNGKAQNPPLTKGAWPAGIGHSPGLKLTGSGTWTTNKRLSEINIQGNVRLLKKMPFLLPSQGRSQLPSVALNPATQLLGLKLKGKLVQGYNTGFVGGSGG